MIILGIYIFYTTIIKIILEPNLNSLYKHYIFHENISPKFLLEYGSDLELW